MGIAARPKTLFLCAALFAAAMGGFWLWALASAAPATECAGRMAMFAEDIRCRWPQPAHYGFKLSGLFALLSLWRGLILRRKSN